MVRVIVAASVLASAILASASGAQGQIGQPAPSNQPGPDTLRMLHDQMVFAGVSDPDRSLVHPVSLALREWEALALTPHQIDALLDVEDELGRAFWEFVQSMQPDLVRPSTWWQDEPVHEDEIRASAYRSADTQVEAVLLLLRLRDRVFAILTDEQQAKLRQAHHQQLGALRDDLMQRPSRRPCTQGGSGGGGILTDSTSMVWSLTFEGDSARIDALFVARYEERVPTGALRRPRPSLPTQALSGGSGGNWYLLFDRATRTAYVQDRALPLGEDNIVLVHGVDRIHEPPDVVATLRAPERFYTGGCLGGEDFVDALRLHIMAVPDIRAFVEGRR